MPARRPRRLLGRCPLFFLLAVSFDVLGLGLILAGIFAELRLDGRSFGEFLIYGGGILLFFSLLWWLAWYSLNLEVSIEELMKDPSDSPKKRHLVELARKVSQRFSKRSRRKAEGPPGSLPGSPAVQTASVFIHIPRAAAVPTTSVFINHSFSSHPDALSVVSRAQGPADRLV
ncbi:transmembrane protein 238-like [Anomaloglossus baeobatrachus]|uniref:transmembrane protein 238-like n=1 Tax=Anomaloglossus baeobatrachus TaxID=238106 RepID=UPI003F50ABC6